MKYAIAEWIYRRLRRLQEAIGELAEHVALCPDCGGNRFHDPPCAGRPLRDIWMEES